MKIETIMTPDEIREWAVKPFVISCLGASIDYQWNGVSVPPSFKSEEDNKATAGIANFSGHSYFATNADSYVTLNKYQNDGNRKIGLIRGILDDGSFYLSILGNGKIKVSTEQSIVTRLWTRGYFPYEDLSFNEVVVLQTSEPAHWTTTNGVREDIQWLSAFYWNGAQVGYDTAVTEDDAPMYIPEWRTPNHASYTQSRVIHLFGRVNGQYIQRNLADIQLTTSKYTTLTIGDEYQQYSFSDPESMYIGNGYKNIGGALYDIASNRMSLLASTRVGHHFVYDEWPPLAATVPFAVPSNGTYAQHYIPFNLILTRNEEEALRYINDGTLPTDAFIYPFDPTNIPINDSGEDPGGDPTGGAGTDVPGEDGEPTDNCDPMPTTVPFYTPQSLTNNNLYWLTAAALHSFIDWFWTDATDVASLGDLWDKITGLYENLSEAILAIRYMPIDISWVGGVTSVSSIIVGMIKKEHLTKAINKSPAPIRQLGYYDVTMLFNGSWCNYTPYSSISLWLPFHGMVALDNDLIMNHKIYVEAIYDILAGTIQYFVHRDSYSGSLIYSCVSRMAVDIPISLQTKTERDSAILQNVSSLTAGLIGAGASAAAGSPIGMTMGLANLAGFQPVGAGMKVTGSVGETGAFYQPKKCAIFIKRPAYNRPKNYKSRVGYPANTTKKLSQCSGFTTCYKPRIHFDGVEYSEGIGQDAYTVHIKPTKQEIERIYEMLESGVII